MLAVAAKILCHLCDIVLGVTAKSVENGWYPVLGSDVVVAVGESYGCIGITVRGVPNP